MTERLRAGDRVLARVPDWLGDVVMAEPALRALHERVRELGGTLSLAGTPRLLEVLGDAFEGCARVDASDAAAWRGHDLAVLFVNSFRSAWTARAARIPRVAGYARELRGFLLTHAVTPAFERGRAPVGVGWRGHWPRYLPRPFGATCAELVQGLGASVRDSRPRLRATEGARTAARERLRSLGIDAGAPFVLANAGGRPDSAKAWPAQSWGSALRDLGVPVVLVAGPGEELALARVRELAPRAHACVEPLAGLGELVALCELASAVATADSGPRHIANAVGTSLVVVCGPTDPRHTADHTGSTRMLRVSVECGPCHLERCPLAGEARHRCMRGVEPELVRRALLAAFLRGREPAMDSAASAANNPRPP